MRKTRATGPLWAVKTGYIVISALFCVLGVVLFVMAERCVPWIGRALGIGMVVCGAVKLGGYFSRDLFRLAFQYDLAFGILLAAVGVITLCHPGEAMTFLCVMFGIPVLADGLFKIQVAVDAKRFGIGQWWLVLLLAVLTGVIGLLLVLRPTEGAQALADYGEDFYAGMPAVTENRLGKGRVIYLAARAEQKFLDLLYARAAR